MGASSSLVWKVYSGALGAVTTIAAQQLVNRTWKLIMKDEPPTPTDPEAPLGEAVSWAIASAIGIAMAQLLTSRYTARRFSEDVGRPAKLGKIKLKI